MKTTCLPIFLLLTLSLAGLEWPAAAQAADGIATAPAFSAKDLAAQPRNGWITYGGALSNQRYSPLTRINRGNVGQLKAVWRADLNGSGLGPQHSGQAQPLVYEGVLYIATGQDDVFAIDIDTGAVLWSYQAQLAPEDVVVCCGWVNRGVGMGEGKVFVGQLNAKLVALDQKTGAVAWSVQAENPRQGYSITAAPLYYDGMVIIGFAGGDMGIRGRVSAYSAQDGSLLWTFYTIPGPGEPGHDTWAQDNDIWKYGGAPLWQTPAIDPELGLIYFATGNPGTALSGATRPGDNLYTDSVLALEVKTGKYRWHFQEVHHDLWDYDAANPVILFDAEIDGVKRKGIAQAGKTGWVYLLERKTGEPLIGIEERPVLQEPRQATAATQPYPLGDAVVPQEVDINPGDHDLINQGRIFTPYFDEPVFYKPMSAVNWPPSSYDPETGLMYIGATDAINGAKVDAEQLEAPNFQAMFYNGSWVPTGAQGRGVMAALDVRTNRLVWRRQWPDAGNGSVVTAGGLLFTGLDDGRLLALDKSSGKQLWEFRTDAGVNSPVATFLHEGEQYVAVLAGGSMFGGPRGDGVWMFSLEGTIDQMPPPPPPNAPAPAVSVPEGRVADIENGRTIYLRSCQVCHGVNGQGSGHEGGGVALTPALTIKDVMTILGAGRNTMPAFSTLLSPEEMHDAGSFVVEALVKR
ncbi:MAG: quinonprotein alcohol dehydrogenase [Gammaproteobacteria bacterium]|nr:MAG: quinonprotein alcohol dehydrogenase [Gammaproteobacteria bacterium]